MHIQQGMYGYWNAAWGAPVTQAGGSPVSWVGAGDNAATTGSSQDAPGACGGGDSQQAGGGNLIMQALAQALESLGLSLSAPASTATTGSSATAPASGSTSSASTTSASNTSASTTSASTTSAAASSTASAAPTNSGGDYSSQAGSIAGDIRHLMHALFADVRAENLLAPSSGTASGTTSSGGPAGSFASGLAALISQIQSGSAPANLQRAFDRLVTNLEEISGALPDPISQGAAGASAPVSSGTSAATSSTTASTSTGTAGASTATSSTASNYQALLVQFLTNLQTDLGLGYGAAASTPAQSATTGLTVNTLA
jgi:hypothetical protein